MENTKARRKTIFAQIYEKITGRVFSSFFNQNPVKINTEFSCYILDQGNPYYHYFLTKEDEKKENIVLIYQSILMKRIFSATGVFVTYNIVKSLLWRRGYFAYFFYHTRNMSFILYLLSLSLIKKNFEANLIRNDLIRYYEKREADKSTEQLVNKEIVKKQILTGRDDVNLLS